MSTLRPFQNELKASINYALAEIEAETEIEHACVMGVLPTGGGKTKTMTRMIEELDAPQAAIAHRSELVGQISMDLARQGIRHSIVGSEATTRTIRMHQLDELGQCFIHPQQDIRVCSVDTLKTLPASDNWPLRVRRWHGDEGHHFLSENKWGRAVRRFMKSQGVLWTATPTRADGKGLGRHADGLADRLLLGPGMRDMIDSGYLTDYRLIVPEVGDLNLNEVAVGSTGDFVFEQMRAAIKKSKSLAGNIVDRYEQFAGGTRAIVFAVDIEECRKYALEFQRRGVRAEVVTGETDATVRRDVLAKFARGEIAVLINVDLFGEGFDVPACVTVIKARPTWSYALDAQQHGRALRLVLDKALADLWGMLTTVERLRNIALSAKPVAIVIDMVGNFMRNHLPDWLGHAPRWSLDRRVGRGGAPSDAIPLRRCGNTKCSRSYEAHLTACPYCHTVPEPVKRSTPRDVDGNIYELTPEALAALRNAVEENHRPPQAMRNYQHHAHNINLFNEKTAALRDLREAAAVWCAAFNLREGRGRLSDIEQAKAFYFKFGVDVMSIMAYDHQTARALLGRINETLRIDNVVIQRAQSGV